MLLPQTSDTATSTPAGAPANEIAPTNSPAPEVPRIRTNLVLTQTQEDALVQRALDRIDELKTEMGLEGMADGQVRTNSWMWKRMANQAQYDNSWEWRKVLGGIFSYSNFSINVAKRFARLISAKVKDDLVGTDPFFAAMPEQHGDGETAKQVEWYLQEAIRHSNTKKNIARGQKTAVIRNEVVMKPTYVSNVTRFTGPARVAVGPAVYTANQGDVFTMAGQPVQTPAGNYIYEKDDFIPDPTVENTVRLQKEPNVAFRHNLTFTDFPALEQTMIHQEGLDVRELDYRDFLCPLNCSSVHEADCCVHLFDEQHERLVAQYGVFEVSEGYVNMPFMSGEKAPKEEQGESDQVTSKVLKVVNCADVYMRCDANDDGMEEEVWLLVDTKRKKAIWYDYLGAHLKKRPFEVIPGIEFVSNRWYGVGVFEMLWEKQLYVDTQFNRVNWKSTKASSARFRNVNAVSQWKAGEEMTFGDDKIWDVDDPRYNAQNPPLFQVQLNEIDEFAMKLLELMIQASSTEVGISGPDDAGFGGLDTSKLATGIKSLERTGNTLMKDTTTDHGDAITALLDQCVDIVLEHMDENELLFHPDSGQLIALNREEIRAMGKKVRLLLTRSRSTETIETSRMVIQLCREYYEAINPYEKKKLRPEYLRQLKAFETPDADKLIDEVSDEQVAQWEKEQAEAANLPPKTSIATKYPDLARSEQIQVLKREGIKPAPDQEIAQQQAQEVQKVAAEEEAKQAAQPDQAEQLEMEKQEHNQKMQHSEEKHQMDMRHAKDKEKNGPKSKGSGTAKASK